MRVRIIVTGGGGLRELSSRELAEALEREGDLAGRRVVSVVDMGRAVEVNGSEPEPADTGVYL